LKREIFICDWCGKEIDWEILGACQLHSPKVIVNGADFLRCSTGMVDYGDRMARVKVGDLDACNIEHLLLTLKDRIQKQLGIPDDN
jgi:hypothetical protein